MKIERNELKELIRESVKRKLYEANGFSAKRAIIDIAQGLSRQFETDIIKTLNLQNPDEMNPDVQKQYLIVVENMKESFVKAAMDATKELIKFPKHESKSE